MKRPRPFRVLLTAGLLATALSAFAVGSGDLARYRTTLNTQTTKNQPQAPASSLGTPAYFGPGESAASEDGEALLHPLAGHRAPRPRLAPADLREPGQLMLYWPDSASADKDLARLAADYRLVPGTSVDLHALGGRLVLIQAADERTLTDLRVRLAQALPDAVVDFNTRYLAEGAPRQYFGQQILTPAEPGPSQAVALLDGPVEAIPALAGSTIVRRSFLGGGDTPTPPQHATAIAALIAGHLPEQGFAGTAPRAALYSAVIMRRQNGIDSSNAFILAQALDWSAAQGARVANLSLGGPGNALMAKLFARATQGSMAIVAAAGNGGPEAPPSYPAAYPGVIAVTATGADARIYPGANQGSYIALAAPGEELWVPLGEGGRYVTGTSYAAGLVSGALARLLGANPTLNGSTAFGHLCNTALDLGDKGPDPVFGCGLLRLGPALKAVARGTP